MYSIQNVNSIKQHSITIYIMLSLLIYLQLQPVSIHIILQSLYIYTRLHNHLTLVLTGSAQLSCPFPLTRFTYLIHRLVDEQQCRRNVSNALSIIKIYNMIIRSRPVQMYSSKTYKVLIKDQSLLSLLNQDFLL